MYLEDQIPLKISIVVPVYKVEKYIEDCLRSLLLQTYPNYEIILIDDASPDRCGEICDMYAEREDRIFVIHQKNAGVSMARNAGLRIASGRYITFVDPDDWVDSDYLSVLAENMVPGGLTACGFVREDARKKPNLSHMAPARNKSVVQMNREKAEFSVIGYNGIGGGCCTKLFDRNIIVQHDLQFQQNVVLYEDQLFVIRYLSHSTGKITQIVDMPYHYRTNPQSAMRSAFSKVNKPDNYIFSPNYVLEEEIKIIEQTPELLELMRIRIIYEKARTILKLEILCKQSHPLFPVYLKDIRKGFTLFWRSRAKGFPINAVIEVILCLISPKLYHFFWKLKGYMKGESRD